MKGQKNKGSLKIQKWERKKAPPGRRMVQQPWKILELIQAKKKTQKQWGPVVAVEVEESCAK